MALHSWLASSRIRHFPSTAPQKKTPILLIGALNESLSFQVCVRSEDDFCQRISIQVESPTGLSCRVRRVGYVPVLHHNTPVLKDPLDTDGLSEIPGLVPDPLLDETEMFLPPQETHAFWITVKGSAGTEPGLHTVRVLLAPQTGRAHNHSVQVDLKEIRLERRKDFRVTHWFYADALSDWYKVTPFSPGFWPLCEAYMRDYASHGPDTLYLPIFTPPLDGVKRPTQLLKVHKRGKDTYRFDWSDVRQWVRLAQRCGIRYFECPHLFTQWGAKHAIRIYEGQGHEERLLWPADSLATSPRYRRFLEQYLPACRDFLSSEKILSKSFFHVSDEPHRQEHIENYRKARGLLKNLAPWMSVMDALTDITFARQGLTDRPIPSIGTALEFVKEKIPCWCYYCCGPRGRYLNRLLDTPLSKISMHGFLFYRWPFLGFLHWGYNYWYQSQTRTLINPYQVQDGLAWERGWAYGDTFQVYPGPHGPVDSMRWEVFSEALQDYALLETLGVDRDDQSLRPVRSFEDFPKGEGWRLKTRARLLAGERR